MKSNPPENPLLLDSSSEPSAIEESSENSKAFKPISASPTTVGIPKGRPITPLGRIWRGIVRIFAVVLILLGIYIALEMNFVVHYAMGNQSCRGATYWYICQAADVVGAPRCFGGLVPGFTFESVYRFYQNPENASSEYRECFMDQWNRRRSCVVPRPINEAILRLVAKIRGKRFYELDEPCPGWHKDIGPIA